MNPREFYHNRGRLTQELFDMVYDWGKCGIITNSSCNAFQEKIYEIEDLYFDYTKKEESK